MMDEHYSIKLNRRIAIEKLPIFELLQIDNARSYNILLGLAIQCGACTFLFHESRFPTMCVAYVTGGKVNIRFHLQNFTLRIGSVKNGTFHRGNFWSTYHSRVPASIFADSIAPVKFHSNRSVGWAIRAGWTESIMISELRECGVPFLPDPRPLTRPTPGIDDLPNVIHRSRDQ